jgi:hypothetical protein
MCHLPVIEVPAPQETSLRWRAVACGRLILTASLTNLGPSFTPVLTWRH